MVVHRLVVAVLIATTVSARDSDPLRIQEDIDHSHSFHDHLLANMERDEEKIIFQPIQFESRSLQNFAKWTPEFKNAMMEASYSSSFSQPKWDPVSMELDRDSEFASKNVLKEIGLEPKNEFDKYVGEDEREKSEREEKETAAFSASENAMEQVLQQTQAAAKTYNAIFDEASKVQILPNITSDDGSHLGINSLGLSIASMALGGTRSKLPMFPGVDGGGFSPNANLGTQGLVSTETAVTNGDSASSGATQSGGADALNDATLAAKTVGAFFGATSIPALMRGYMRDQHLIPNKVSTPKIMSHEAPPVPSEIKGYDPSYYAALASAKDVPMWWSHTGAHMTPPWFQSNAPPNRAHLGRAAVNVPAPPFVDSPYRSTILDYWTGKRSKFIAPVPKPWPTHHMMADLNGDGALKCPCPKAPQLMCDCSAIEYDALSVAPKSDEEKMDPGLVLKKKFQEAGRNVLGNLMRQPYPEMMLMGTLM